MLTDEKMLLISNFLLLKKYRETPLSLGILLFYLSGFKVEAFIIGAAH